jgi:phosphatidylglycerophosphatase A
MIRVHKLIAGCFGIGLVKGGGTLAAALCCAIWWLWQKDDGFNNIMIAVTSLITVTGIWSSSQVETDWGKDSSRVVIDEAAGMCISLLFIPVTPVYIITAFALFRFFDILKPLYIRRAEALPGGWGVMMDDVLAGIYSNLVLQAIIYVGIL